MNTKACSVCRVEKPMTEFYASNDRRHGRSSCKDCRRARRPRRWTTERPCPKCKTVKPLTEFPHGSFGYCAACRAAGGEKGSMARRRFVTYGLSAQEFDEMLEAQGGVCAICGRPETAQKKDGTVRPLAVDHDHDTGIVRGLLCGRCNVAIGMMDDDPEVLRRAIAYLTGERGDPVVTSVRALCVATLRGMERRHAE